MFKKLLIALFIICLALTFYNLLPETELPKNAKIDFLVVDKSDRELKAFSNGLLLKKYSVSIGMVPVGKKRYEGDLKTPEGTYFINGKNSKSICYKSLGISYPNAQDIKAARKSGKSAGGDIMIHGALNYFGFVGKLHRWFLPTLGCVMVTNQEMDELFSSVIVGTKIVINP